MASQVELTLHENNDETIAITITPEVEGEDLSTITTLELYLKVGAKYPDTDPTTLILTSANPGEIDILTQASAEITAEAFIPAAQLTAPYDRFWHLDALTAGGARRTAMYGPVDVINL